MYPTIKEGLVQTERFGTVWFDILKRKPTQAKFAYFSKEFTEYSPRKIALNIYSGETKTQYFFRVPYRTQLSEIEFTESATCHICQDIKENCVSVNIEQGIDNGSYWKHSEKRACKDCCTEIVDLTNSIVQNNTEDITVDVV